MKPGTPLEVTWLDASSIESWQDASDIAERPTRDMLVECKTRGYFIRHDKIAFVLCCTVAENGGFGGVWAIPVGSVTRVRRTT